jgi:hypothetical protein
VTMTAKWQLESGHRAGIAKPSRMTLSGPHH